MKFSQSVLVTLLFFISVSFAHAESAAYELAQRYGCMACHSAKEELIGPSFKAIADKYRSDADAKNKLIAKLKAGGSGVWGVKVQPAYRDEIKNQQHYGVLIDWVLSQH
ncbi:MAG TPA: c-type cytochrome [Methylophilaceae bacterium]